MTLFTNKILKLLSHFVNKCSLGEFSDVNHGKKVVIRVFEHGQTCTCPLLYASVVWRQSKGACDWMHCVESTIQDWIGFTFRLLNQTLDILQLFYGTEKKKATACTFFPCALHGTREKFVLFCYLCGGFFLHIQIFFPMGDSPCHNWYFPCNADWKETSAILSINYMHFALFWSKYSNIN